MQQAEPVALGKDIAVVSGLLEIVVILWRSVEKALKQNEEAQKYINAKFGNVMSKYFQTFEVRHLQWVVGYSSVGGSLEMLLLCFFRMIGAVFLLYNSPHLCLQL